MKLDDKGKATQESVDIAWHKIGGILRIGKQPEWKRALYYARGILRNRVAYVNEWHCMKLMERAVTAGVDPDWIKQCALECSSWNQFQWWIEEAIKGADKDGKGS